MGNSIEITVEELKARLDQGDRPFILDVREQHEYDICHLADTTLIPMSVIESRYSELNPDVEIVVHCRSGARSARVCHFLMSKGFQNVKNLAGGILAWSDRIDPTIPKY